MPAAIAAGGGIPGERLVPGDADPLAAPGDAGPFAAGAPCWLPLGLCGVDGTALEPLAWLALALVLCTSTRLCMRLVPSSGGGLRSWPSARRQRYGSLPELSWHASSGVVSLPYGSVSPLTARFSSRWRAASAASRRRSSSSWSCLARAASASSWARDIILARTCLEWSLGSERGSASTASATVVGRLDEAASG